ncbi:MAG: exo-alpha-sialidase [Candidatus Hydrogenedentes bacterium]|nr:exo-alpha-sialidase [Candidatus Hydrogenedentota bacterium]
MSAVRFASLVALLVFTIVSGPALAQDMYQKTKPDIVIYDGSYPGWPWITAGASGTLYCVWREGTVHDYSAEGRIMLAQSSDKGRTWTEAKVIIDEPNVDDRNVAIVELPNGELLVTYNTYTEARESLAMMSRSSDGGKTWAKAESIGVPNSRTRAAAVVLSNGDLLLPLYTAPGNGAIAALSYNNGRNWESIAIPNADGFLGDEWTALEVEPKRIIGISRNNVPQSDGFFWLAESKDRGKTWSAPVKTNVQSERHPSPAQLCMHNSTPTLVFSDRRMVSVAAVKSSDPGFAAWDVGQRFKAYQYKPDAAPIPDGSYPCSVQVTSKIRLIVDYEIGESGGKITGYYCTFPENW